MADKIIIENLYGHSVARTKDIQATNLLTTPYSNSVIPTTYGLSITAPEDNLVTNTWKAGSWSSGDEHERTLYFTCQTSQVSSLMSNHLIGYGSQSFSFDIWNGVDAYETCTLSGYQVNSEWHMYWTDSGGNMVSDELISDTIPSYAMCHSGYILNESTGLYDAGMMLFLRSERNFGSVTDPGLKWYRFTNMGYNSGVNEKYGIDRLLPFYTGQMRIQSQPSFMNDPVKYTHSISSYGSVTIM